MYQAPQVVEVNESHGTPLPVIATLPHSGRYLPPEIAAHMAPRHVHWLKNTDWYLNELYSFLPELGVTTVSATHSRYVVDVNRNPNLTRPGEWSKSAVTLFTDMGEPVYLATPREDEAIARIRQYHHPFHRALREQLQVVLAIHGRALLLDLHSFMGPTEYDVCLGNLRQATTTAKTFEAVCAAFRGSGFDVGDNNPYAGGYIVKEHHRPGQVESLLVELRYPNYLDCATIDYPCPPSFEPNRIAEAATRVRGALEVLFNELYSDA
jgi:N-formylglutamate deformylase